MAQLDLSAEAIRAQDEAKGVFRVLQCAEAPFSGNETTEVITPWLYAERQWEGQRGPAERDYDTFYYPKVVDDFTRWMDQRQSEQSTGGDEYYVRWDPRNRTFSIHKEAIEAELIEDTESAMMYAPRICVLFSVDRGFRANAFRIVAE